MAFLDFLKRKSNGKAKPPADQRADIDAALAKIAQERAGAQEVLVSTPEEKCIDFPEQKYISEAGKKGR